MSAPESEAWVVRVLVVAIVLWMVVHSTGCADTSPGARAVLSALSRCVAAALNVERSRGLRDGGQAADAGVP